MAERGWTPLPATGPVLTDDYPDATRTLVYSIYLDGFVNFQFGYAQAQAFVLFLIILILTLLQFRFVERRVHYA